VPYFNGWHPPYLYPIRKMQRSKNSSKFHRWALMKQRQAYVCKSEEKLLERLDQPILDLIDNPQKTQQTTAIGTLF